MNELNDDDTKRTNRMCDLLMHIWSIQLHNTLLPKSWQFGLAKFNHDRRECCWIKSSYYHPFNAVGLNQPISIHLIFDTLKLIDIIIKER